MGHGEQINQERCGDIAGHAAFATANSETFQVGTLVSRASSVFWSVDRPTGCLWVQCHAGLSVSCAGRYVTLPCDTIRILTITNGSHADAIIDGQ